MQGLFQLNYIPCLNGRGLLMAVVVDAFISELRR